MLSAVAKAYLILAVLVGAFALVYVDPLSLGQGRGSDHFGATLLIMASIGAMAFAVATSFRSVTDHEVERPAAVDALPTAMHAVASPGPSVGASAFPLVVAVGLVLVGVAAAWGAVAFYLAIALLLVGGGGWLGQAFTEHPLATARLGDRASRRTVSPFTYPVVAVLLGGVVAVSVSRLYLTLTEEGAIIVSGLVAVVLFVGCLVLANGGNVGRRLTAGMAGIALVSVVGAGAASAARGERIIEHHEGGEVTEVEIRAEGIAYDTKTLTLTEGKVEFTFENEDPAAVYHNIGIYSAKEAGTPFVAILPIPGGGTQRSALIDTKVVGLVAGRSYWFRCDFHPAMVGTVTVEPAADKESSEKSEKKVEKHG